MVDSPGRLVFVDEGDWSIRHLGPVYEERTGEECDGGAREGFCNRS